MDFSVLKTFASGLVIGSSMLIPGLSGGTMAIIIGIYDRLISAVSGITSSKEKCRESLPFLLVFMIGASVGIYLFSGFILSAVSHFKGPFMFLFMGIILASIPTLFKKTGAKKIKASDIILMLSGLAVCIFISLFKISVASFDGTMSIKSFFVIILAGLFIAIALILPGISCSHMLLLLGVFEITLDAVKFHNFLFLIPLSLSVIIGILLFTSLVDKILKNHTRKAYFLIIGFVAGSVIDAFPYVPKGFEAVVCVATFLLGLFLMTIISKILKKYRKEGLNG